MAYNELVKNFERVRSYIREFYLYGFKSRTEYQEKSARSYDDERRRIESWLGEYMGFVQTPEGKIPFLSVDSRTVRENPFHKIWKTKSFTDGDITLHFLLLDILHTPEEKRTLAQILEELDRYLSRTDSTMTFDESTVRKKLKEYTLEGIIRTEKEGRRVLYSRMPGTDLSGAEDLIRFFSESAPCGVIGSFLLDKIGSERNLFAFKHHYMTQTMDSDVLATLFDAMGNQRYVTAVKWDRRKGVGHLLRLVPLQIRIGTQNGRQHLVAYREDSNRMHFYRLDYLSDIRQEEPCPGFPELRDALNRMEPFLWGVNLRSRRRKLERVEFEIRVEPGEAYILRRLEREKRCGRVERVDETHYRYTAEVPDSRELFPWMRTFLCRITRLNFSNRTVENQFREDIQTMYRMYGIEGGDAT